MSSQGRTSDFYRTKNIPERFDNPDDDDASNNKSSGQICYIAGNPVFSCINPPPSIRLTDYCDQEAQSENKLHVQEIIQGYSEKVINPIYRTSNMDYGLNKPNVHTMPTVYYAKTAAFTGHLGKTGMYRNQGLNTSVTRSKV